MKQKETKGPKDEGTKGLNLLRSLACGSPLLSWTLGLLVLWSLGPFPSARADDWAPNLTLAGVWDSNVTNAELESDQIDSLQFKADLLASKRYGLAANDSLHLSGHAGGEWWPRYDGLLNGAVGGRIEWRHKFGLGALAPVFAAELAADGVQAREDGRSGSTTALTLSLRKRFSDTLRLTLWHEIARKDARFAVFDRQGNETTLELDRDFNEVTRLTLGVRHRNGDILSYATPPRPDLVDLAPNRLAVDTFDRPMTAYSIDARTWSARGAVTRALDDSSAIIAAYEYRQTKRGTLSYGNHLVSIALVHQF